MKLSAMTAMLAAAMLSTSTLATAQLVTNGAPNNTNGNEFTQWVQAENFTLTSAATIGGIRFWAGSSNSVDPFAGQIWWAIASASSPFGSPTAILASGQQAGARTLQGANTFGGSVWQHELSVNVALAAGDYYLLLHNGPLSQTTRADYYWVTTDTPNAPTGIECESGNGAFPGDLATCGWAENGQEHAFELYAATNVVPEPSTYALMGTGLLSLAGIARRRKGKAAAL
jgi:hypothetical protein